MAHYTQRACLGKATTMDMQVNHNPMKNILSLLRQDRKIEAIKAFREAFGVSDLRTAKDAVETINECLPASTGQGEYIVISRYEPGDDYQVLHAGSKEQAMHEANSIVDARVEVAVAGIVARSVVTRAMAEVT